MLMQLVCVDRRYQRMNCFNIRELQGILKRRFFTDLVNSADHRDLLSTSMVGLRFKSNNSTNLDHDTLNFFKLGTNNSNKARSSNYSNEYLSFLGEGSTNPFSHVSFSVSSGSAYFLHYLIIFTANVVNVISYSPIASLMSLLSTNCIGLFTSLLQVNLTFTQVQNSTTVNSIKSTGLNSTVYSSSNVSQLQSLKYSFLEQDNLSRFSRFNNPIISYDYKCGNYIGI